jgi:signal transduction histidine kinase
VITAPPDSVPGIVAAAAGNGVAAAVILTAGLGHGAGSLAEAVESAARENGLRIVGPNCLGVMAPAANFNVSFATRMPRQGDLALVSQSGAIVAGVAEWAAQRAIGCAVVSIGDQLDVDFGDLLDFFALDRARRAILLYVESVKNARKFMSAARAAGGKHHQAGASALALVGAKERGIRVTFQLDPRADLVLADKVQVQQVLINLLRNAIDAMEGSQRRELVVATRAEDDGMVAVSVADTGSGVASEVAGQLFQPFVTTKRQGMGVGLSISRTIVEAHGGEIWLEPNPEGGTVFHFTVCAVSKGEAGDAE